MRELAAGDDAALGSLIAGWQEPVLHFVFRYVQSEADARDIVQETFVRLHAGRGVFRPGTKVASWIFTIAANLCRNRVRWLARHRAESFEEGTASALACHRPAPDRAAEQAERIRAVQSALAGLPHELKVTLLLYEYENLSYAEIASVVGCTVKGVESRLARARARLRAALAAYLADATGPAPFGRVAAGMVAAVGNLAPTVSK